MKKILNNIEIATRCEKERRRIKIKVERVYLDINNVFKKLHKLKDNIGSDADKLDLINLNISKFEKFQKDLGSIWGEYLKKDFEEDDVAIMDDFGIIESFNDIKTFDIERVEKKSYNENK